MGDDDWKKKRRKKYDDDDDDDRKRKYYPKADKKDLLDRIFEMLDGPNGATLLKLMATGFICLTTVGLTGILSLAQASTNLLMTTVGFGLGTTAITWLFGGWKKQVQAAVKVKNHESELAEMNAKLAELEERLANVEVIERFEDRLAARVIDSTSVEEVTHGEETTYGSHGIHFEQ